ncbi:iron ABC transporter permease [Paenibacillus sp. CF384]|uniref:FecCD family ABC transporter permease n=1 Tax=Paenibacillus sp. CF384 TaxID=1884382 RepID=UPI000894AB0F|nr:iron ABC transporter permease [Paenibacillus sp. CF384]SDW99267.1 iron complex transport system permease protein [Paenibacillus sp. CF384]
MNDLIKMHQAHNKKVAFRNTAIVLMCACALTVSFIVSMNTGHAKLTALDTLRTLFGGGTEREHVILFDFRLPRITLSILVGAGLALSGCTIQGVTKNALADPGLLGISAGAGLMVILFTMFVGTGTLLSIFTLPFLALVGAGLTAIMVYVLAYKKTDGVAPMRLILTGIAVQAGISALTTVLVIKLSEEQFDFVAVWQAGNIWGGNWKFVLALLPWLLILIPYLVYNSRKLDVLSMSEDTAYSLGVAVVKQHRKLLLVSVALAASCVSVSGSIGFVGLIAPHLARRLVGSRHIILLPVCALVGAVLVSVADTLSRVILPPAGIPTGIIVAIIGAPYFLYLLATAKER